MIHLLRIICELQRVRYQIDRATWAIEVVDFNSEVRFDPRGCLEVVVSLEAANAIITIAVLTVDAGRLGHCPLV